MYVLKIQFVIWKWTLEIEKRIRVNYFNCVDGLQVEVINVEGRLISADGLVSTSCWLKIVEIANDCQSCNVLLMITAEGVMLKTIRDIIPGEPLLMWFTEAILAMLNIPFLTPSNIQGKACIIK